jgi:hypothetical protein
VTEFQFLQCLRSRYADDAYVVLPQVRSTTGFSRRKVRTADALAVSLWPSRGISVSGFEFKDSRTDWLKELAEPQKAEEIGRFCSEWWLVVSDPKIVAAGELPAPWGMIYATEGKCKTLAKVTKRSCQEPTWEFVAAVMRAAKDHVTPEAEIATRVQAAEKKVRERYAADVQAAVSREQMRSSRDLAALKEVVAEFEAASGIKLGTTWESRNGKKVGEAVKFVMDGGLDGRIDRVMSLERQVRQVADELQAVIGEKIGAAA